MIKIETFLESEENYDFSSNIACIGFFDGIHSVHQKILLETKKIALDEKMTWSILTFSEKVLDFLKNKKTNLQSNEKKYQIFEKLYNPSYLIEIKVNSKTVQKSAKYFCDFISSNFKVKKLVIGSDFRFGFKGEGDVKFLQEYFGFENVIIFNRVKEVSTTLIKEKLKKGDIYEVNKILSTNFTAEIKKTNTHNYFLSGLGVEIADGNYKVLMDDETKIINLVKNSFVFNGLIQKLELEFLEKV